MSKHEPAPFEATSDSDNIGGVDDRSPERIDRAHRAAVEAGLADMRAGRIASAAEIEAAYARFGRISR